MTAAEIARLTERDVEVLGELVVAYDQRAQFGWPTTLDGMTVLDGVAPIDCGGTNCSDHSYRLTKLVKLGLAEHRKRGFAWGRAPTQIRGSKVYRPTPAGRALLEREAHD